MFLDRLLLQSSVVYYWVFSKKDITAIFDHFEENYLQKVFLMIILGKCLAHTKTKKGVVAHIGCVLLFVITFPV